MNIGLWQYMPQQQDTSSTNLQISADISSLFQNIFSSPKWISITHSDTLPACQARNLEEILLAIPKQKKLNIISKYLLVFFLFKIATGFFKQKCIYLVRFWKVWNARVIQCFYVNISAFTIVQTQLFRHSQKKVAMIIKVYAEAKLTVSLYILCHLFIVKPS